MVALPLHPRLAHMILAALQEDMAVAACDTAAILSERDPLYFLGRERDADLRLRLDALQAYQAKRPFHIHGCSVDALSIRHILKVSAVLQQRLGINKKTNGASEPGRLLASGLEAERERFSHVAGLVGWCGGGTGRNSGAPATKTRRSSYRFTKAERSNDTRGSGRTR